MGRKLLNKPSYKDRPPPGYKSTYFGLSPTGNPLYKWSKAGSRTGKKKHMLNSARNKAASRIAKAFRKSFWRRSRAKTPFGPRSWAAKTSKYGTAARIAQNKWRTRYSRKHGTTAYKRMTRFNYTW